VIVRRGELYPLNRPVLPRFEQVGQRRRPRVFA
jgi:hypothetical protein